MPKIIITDEVDDVDQWLAPPQREEVFAGVAEIIRTVVHPKDRSTIVRSTEVTGFDEFARVIEIDAGPAAAKYDGGRLDTVVP